MRFAYVLSMLTVATAFPQAKPVSPSWTQWGGPLRDFHTQAANIAPQWPPAGPKVLWKRPLGEGYSSLLTDGTTIWTMYGRAGQEIVMAADATNGKTLWEHSSPVLFRSDAPDMGNGPHATALIVGDRLFAVGTTGLVQCLDKKSGKFLWSRELGGSSLVYGYSSSPIAYRDLLILPAGGKGRAVVALHQKDGSTAWQRLDFDNAYSSPILINIEGLDQLVTVMKDAVFAVNPLNGDLQWRISHQASYGLNVSAPVLCPGNILFVSSEYDAGAKGIQLKREGNRVIAKEIWSTNRLRLHHGNAVMSGGVLLFSSGGKGSVAVLTAIDPTTGKIHWQNRTFGKATFVEANGKVIVIDQDGDIALATASPQGINVISRTPMLNSIAWTPPTLVGTKLYIRDRTQMIALELKP